MLKKIKMKYLRELNSILLLMIILMTSCTLNKSQMVEKSEDLLENKITEENQEKSNERDQEIKTTEDTLENINKQVEDTDNELWKIYGWVMPWYWGIGGNQNYREKTYKVKMKIPSLYIKEETGQSYRYYFLGEKYSCGIDLRGSIYEINKANTFKENMRNIFTSPSKGYNDTEIFDIAEIEEGYTVKNFRYGYFIYNDFNGDVLDYVLTVQINEDLVCSTNISLPNGNDTEEIFKEMLDSISFKIEDGLWQELDSYLTVNTNESVPKNVEELVYSYRVKFKFPYVYEIGHIVRNSYMYYDNQQSGHFSCSVAKKENINTAPYYGVVKTINGKTKNGYKYTILTENTETIKYGYGDEEEDIKVFGVITKLLIEIEDDMVLCINYDLPDYQSFKFDPLVILDSLEVNKSDLVWREIRKSILDKLGDWHDYLGLAEMELRMIIPSEFESQNGGDYIYKNKEYDNSYIDFKIHVMDESISYISNTEEIIKNYYNESNIDRLLQELVIKEGYTTSNYEYVLITNDSNNKNNSSDIETYYIFILLERELSVEVKIILPVEKNNVNTIRNIMNSIYHTKNFPRG